MDLKTAGLLIAFVTGLLGLLGSVGAYFESVESTKDAISELKTAEDNLHKSASKRIDVLERNLNLLNEREATLEKTTAVHDDKLQTARPPKTLG